MKKKSYPVYLSGEARGFAQRRIDDEAHPYEGFSAYAEAAILYDMIVGLPHALLSDLMARPDRLRRKLIEELMEKSSAGELPEGWVKDRIRSLVSAEVREKCTLCREKPAKQG